VTLTRGTPCIYIYVCVYIYIYIYTHTYIYLVLKVYAPNEESDDSKESFYEELEQVFDHFQNI